MNKNVVIGVGVVAILGLAGYIVYTKLKKPATTTTNPGNANGVAPGTSSTGSNANQTNWLGTIGGLFGDLGHIFTGNSTTPTNNTTTAGAATDDNSGSSWDDIVNAFA